MSDTSAHVHVQAATYVVLDFETTTPKGFPPEPIEIAAACIGPGPAMKVKRTYEELIRPPEHAPITHFDTAQTGISRADVRDRADVYEVLARFNAELGAMCVGGDHCVLVAQNARYEAAILNRFIDYCPATRSLPIIDTVTLAKHLLTGLSNYKLDTLAYHFSVPVPTNRHRALPDVLLTAEVFVRLLSAFQASGRSRLEDLVGIASVRAEPAGAPPQLELF